MTMIDVLIMNYYNCADEFIVNTATFVVHSAWTLLRSVSNHICFLMLIYQLFLS